MNPNDVATLLLGPNHDALDALIRLSLIGGSGLVSFLLVKIAKAAPQLGTWAADTFEHYVTNPYIRAQALKYVKYAEERIPLGDGPEKGSERYKEVEHLLTTATGIDTTEADHVIHEVLFDVKNGLRSFATELGAGELLEGPALLTKEDVVDAVKQVVIPPVITDAALIAQGLANTAAPSPVS